MSRDFEPPATTARSPWTHPKDTRGAVMAPETRLNQAEIDALVVEVQRLRVVHQAISECRDDPAKAIVDADRIAGAAIIRALDAESQRDIARAGLVDCLADLTEAQYRISRALGVLSIEACADEARAILTGDSE